jgi:hypothetical protein
LVSVQNYCFRLAQACCRLHEPVPTASQATRISWLHLSASLHAQHTIRDIRLPTKPRPGGTRNNPSIRREDPPNSVIMG